VQRMGGCPAVDAERLWYCFYAILRAISNFRHGAARAENARPFSLAKPSFSFFVRSANERRGRQPNKRITREGHRKSTMRTSKPQSRQPRHRSRPARSSPTAMRVGPGGNAKHRERMTPSPQSRPVTPSPPQQVGGYRYVDIRAPVPVSQFHDGSNGYFQPVGQTPSPLTVATGSSASPTPHRRRSNSPYSFVPIPRDGNDLRGTASPYSFRKVTSPSPSSLSMITSDGTVETASMTMDSSYSRICSPTFGTPPLFRPPTPQSRESPRPRTPTGRKSPFPKSNGGAEDATRKTRIKTEMCMHYLQNRPCPFASTCIYAHGEEELQMTKLIDLDEAGLIDVDTYRTKPCLTWVMTGSWYAIYRRSLSITKPRVSYIPFSNFLAFFIHSPFGQRCAGIHDPRVEGSTPSWLTHTETQGNTIATDINVEALHQKRLNEIHSGTPFGSKFSLERDSWYVSSRTVSNPDVATD